MANFFEMFKKIILSAFLWLIFLYLVYQIINGHNGFFSYIKQKAIQAKTEQDFQVIQAKKSKLENSVNRLYPKSLDEDLLDERLRRATGLVKSNEVIYYYE